jgi:hypothetical protein
VAISFDAWLGTASPATVQPIPAADRAALAYSRILDRPTSIVLRTAAGANRAAQTVRIELDNRVSLSSSAAGSAPQMSAVIYGIRGHSVLADTAMAEGDRFQLGGDSFRIQDIILQIGEIQGVAVATG